MVGVESSFTMLWVLTNNHPIKKLIPCIQFEFFWLLLSFYPLRNIWSPYF